MSGFGSGALSVLSGGFVGFSLGLIGGGGSILATPLLLYVVGIRDAHVAIGTSALAVSLNAYANLIAHARAGTVRWRNAILFALIGVIGAFIGSSLGKAFNGQRLLFLFGILMVIVGLAMLRPKKAGAGKERAPGSKTNVLVGTIGFSAGAASGFFGIGGGFLIVPGLMLSSGMPMINAVGSSLFAVGTFGLATAVNYAWSGLIDWTVAAEFIFGGVIGGLIGMKLAVYLGARKNTLNLIFVGIIFIVAAYVLYRSGRTLMG